MPKDFCGAWNKRKAKRVLAAECQVLLLSGYDMPGKVSRHGMMAEVRNHPLWVWPLFLPLNTCTSWVFRAGYSSTTNLCWIIGYRLLRQAGDIQNGTWYLVWTEDLVTWDVGRHSPCSVALSCKLLKMSQELKLDIRDSCLIDLKKGQRRESVTSLATVRFSWWSQPWRTFIDLVICIELILETPTGLPSNNRKPVSSAKGSTFPPKFSALRLEGTDWGKIKEMTVLPQFLLFPLLKPHLLQSAASQHNKLLSREKSRRLVSCVFQ